MAEIDSAALTAAIRGFMDPIGQEGPELDLDAALRELGYSPQDVQEVALRVGAVHAQVGPFAGSGEARDLLAAELGSAFVKGLAVGTRLGRFYPEGGG